MSDFPAAGKYRNTLSNSQIRYLAENGWNGPSDLPVVIRKEKGACLYDVDGNKYSDFDLHDGAAIAGHNHGTLTQFVKNGISSGSSSGNLSKFTARLVRQFRGLADFRQMSFFSQAQGAYSAVIRTFRPATIGVTSTYLLEFLKPYGGETAEKGKKYDILFYEPLDFDGNLDDLTPDKNGFRYGISCSVESRTAFRLNPGFTVNAGKADLLLVSGCIANGLDCAAVLSDKPVTGENLPVYKTVAVMETLKYFARSAAVRNLDMRNLIAGKEKNLVFRKNIFRIDRKFDPSSLLQYGIHIRGQIGFISTEHTEFDWKRLITALDQVSNS